MKKFNVRLPRKMSALIRVALADLIKTEKTKGYTINMGIWHELHLEPDTKPTAAVCHVCFAGSVLAQHGFPKRRREMDLYKDVTEPVRRKMYALNSLRGGNVAEAAAELHLLKLDSSGDPMAGTSLDKLQDLDTNIASYSENPTQFKRDMRKLARRLERNGL